MPLADDSTSTNLIIGASGQVGQSLVASLAARGTACVGTYGMHRVPGLEQLNIADGRGVWELVQRVRPAVIYLPASLTNVDYCEEHPAEGYAANVQGVLNVVKAANDVGAMVVYLSSDYVFDGHAGPYAEEDPPNPICEYGKQKLMAEHVIGWQAKRALVVRTTVVFGPERLGKNFIYRLVRTLRQGLPIAVPRDQIGSPTYGPDLASRLIDLVQAGATGLFHLTGPESLSRYEFAGAAARVFELPAELIRPVATSELRQPARRPLKAGLRIDKLVSVTGEKTLDFRTGLHAMRAFMEKIESSL